jgi:hypothetical protein
MVNEPADEPEKTAVASKEDSAGKSVKVMETKINKEEVSDSGKETA